MKYYILEDATLVQYNPETKVARIRNTITTSNNIIPLDEFEAMNKKQIKKDKFSELMNIFFKGIKHKWIYEGKHYRKLDNFEDDQYSLSINYDLNKLPRHAPHDRPDDKNYIMVYHWGRVYLHTISYNGYPQGQLVDIKTGNCLRWAQLKHCAPILLENKKKIV